jgi:hypothetical protein
MFGTVDNKDLGPKVLDSSFINVSSCRGRGCLHFLLALFNGDFYLQQLYNCTPWNDRMIASGEIEMLWKEAVTVI